jgi:signal peptidase I
MKKIAVDNKTLGQAIINTLKDGQKAQITVRGQSMYPFFKDGKTQVTLTTKESYQKGDVIFFSYQDQYRLHRIISIKDQEVICSGDFLRQKEIINTQDIIGYVESYENHHKIIVTTSKNYRFKVFLWSLLKPFILFLVRR